MTQPPAPLPVLVVGAGLAGLTTAIHLQRRDVPVRVLEAGDRPGGRVRTDPVDGFALDRGFQVLLDSYSEARSTLDLSALELGRFVPGAMVWNGQRLVRAADPLRRPQDAWATLRSGLANVGDVARLGGWLAGTLRRGARGWTTLPDDLDTEAALRARGLSHEMIEQFWRPFLGGVLLDRDLRASQRTLGFLIRHFATGHATLPTGGMGAIAEQLASRLAPGTLQLGTPVVEVKSDGVRIDGGEWIEGAAVVIATDAAVAGRLLPSLAVPNMREVGCLYLDAPSATAPPVSNHLVLDGTGEGVINHLCLPSEVAPGYAPAGRTLVSASILADALDDSDDAIEKRAREQLRSWFGDGVDGWRTLRMVRVASALPAQPPGPHAARERPARVDDGLFVAGDHRDVASIQGAMASGRRTAAAISEALA